MVDFESPAEDVREASSANLTRLREVWAALGCAYNPNDFHISVQQTMWTQALNMIREATEQTSRVYRENQQLEEALLVARTSPSAPPAEDVREALEAIWDDGNATGLDGWVGPGRGASPIDAEAVEARRRSIERHGATLVVRPRGTVTDAEVEAAADMIAEHRAGTVYPGDRAEARMILEAAAGVVSSGLRPTAPAPAAPVVMHTARGAGTACGLSRDAVSHITDGVRYADCVPCLRTVARS